MSLLDQLTFDGVVLKSLLAEIEPALMTFADIKNARSKPYADIDEARVV